MKLAVIVQAGLKRMLVDNEDVYYYITTLNENYAASGHAGRRGGGHSHGHVQAARRRREAPARTA